MDNKQKSLNNYIEANLSLKACVDKLDELRKEKQEILALVATENPPSDILDRMKNNEREFEKLLKISEKLKKAVKNA